MPTPNTSIIDGAQSFYESAARLAATEMPGAAWPTWPDLTADQLRAWLLAYAANIEVAVRMGDAMLSLGEDLTP